MKAFVLYDGEHAFYHDDPEQLAQHIAELCDIDEGDKIVISTMEMTQEEFEGMPEVTL